MTIIRPETSDDEAAIADVNVRAFGQGDESQLVDLLRVGGFVEVSLVAERDGRVVGHILFSRLVIECERSSLVAVSLAPMAVIPQYQRQGIGSALVRAGLAACRQAGQRIAVVLGHPEYYPRFGFSAQLAEGLDSPFGGGAAWMALELIPGALTGITGRVIYPPPFTSFE